MMRHLDQNCQVPVQRIHESHTAARAAPITPTNITTTKIITNPWHLLQHMLMHTDHSHHSTQHLACAMTSMRVASRHA